ncbi:MAG: hypothetical protein COV91_02135 [Candidatus Taylorbacteria bacterium CG11_big_fil_rev_8_21_14_0_20_46_11]|uniref:Uncharacterized protein n=1 Tax=Candidatus Taylorbacteria bacterium CG11_big_fil_rev_8_21_14_0_20_46_11 TaxID=1975025 RepID=A0A2H0KC59_9BACT|nr:MAG: hypothetical protein COV91_02135 [Candidatus Taylorbacteria bacterium CG11_big_fil_rev_8_21_14_0_20_46_11]
MQITFPLVINPLVFAGILAVVILILGTFSVVFIYHWKEYGMETPYIKRAPKIYLSVTALLCTFAVVSYFILIS